MDIKHVSLYGAQNVHNGTPNCLLDSNKKCVWAAPDIPYLGKRADREKRK
jgi:hypothetical protein